MIVSIHQPAYLPWLGYLDKIARSDTFVYLDSVQFEKNSFTNRNKIKTPQGPLWLTVPVLSKGHLGKTMADMEIADGQKWNIKHLKSIQANYSKASRFAYLYPKLEKLYVGEYRNFADMCWEHLHFWLNEVGLRRTILRGRDMPVSAEKSELVLSICRKLSADKYISGSQGKNYLDVQSFASAGIEVEFQEYQHPEYQQLWGAFEPYMSVLDFLMNTDNFKLISEKL